MSFVKVVDAYGKHWVLNKAHIVGVAPTWGADSWQRGAQILLDKSAYENGTVNIEGAVVDQLLLELGVMR